MVTHQNLAQRSSDTEKASGVEYDHKGESHSTITPWTQRENAWDQAQFDASHPTEYETQT